MLPIKMKLRIFLLFPAEYHFLCYSTSEYLSDTLLLPGNLLSQLFWAEFQQLVSNSVKITNVIVNPLASSQIICVILSKNPLYLLHYSSYSF